MKKKYPNVSVIVATLNNSTVLRMCLNGLLAINYPGRYDIIVVNDGSTDNTKNILDKEFSRNKKINVIHIPHSGVCVARNVGIENSKGKIVVNMDHDCIPERDWLTKLVDGFSSDMVGVVSSYGYYGGTSTAFRRDLLEKVGGYDNEYYYYREDTDLSFKIMDLGYKFILVEAGYKHDHDLVKPKGISGAIKYVTQRWKYHMNDVLLFKKHPTLARDFLDVRVGFLINPLKDFKVATGLWRGDYNLSSPRGMTFLKNKSPVHSTLIFFVGLLYVVGVKYHRLIGSLKFGKFLI